MNILLRGGTVVSSVNAKKLDVLISGSKIVKVARFIKDNDAQVVDVSGKLIFPGFIDAHTHFDLEVSDTVTADGFESGTKAAVCGGTTTVIDFATQNKGESLSTALNNWHIKAFSKSSCDYAFHMAISDWNDHIKEELKAMFEQGVTSFKAYMTYDTMKLSDEELFDMLSTLKELCGIVGVHCENDGIIKALTKKRLEDNTLTVSAHPKVRPSACEAEAITRLLSIAQVVDVPVVVVHLSSKDGLEAVRNARQKGAKVYVETCPQYLLLDDSRYEQNTLQGARFVCSPPLRKKEDSKALWGALKNGEIQTVATDHCSFTLQQKSVGLSDFTKMPNGLPSVESRVVLMYTYGVQKKRITLENMCRLLAENPAKLYGMYPRKGVIKAGSDADIVVFSPKADGFITKNTHHSKADYTPFEGVRTKGKVEKVYLRGKLVVDNGEVVNENKGKYIKRSKPNFI
ncbi:MAG: dihydropyrimidinase [Ruminococcaceae bacterium]|nr:dihydropyrimidinase [Oscillospiraceae bacterium]